MWETERFDVAERLAVSKARLSDKLHELSRRVDTVRETASKAQVLKQPWVLVAAATAIGFVIGLRRRRARLPAGTTFKHGAIVAPGIGSTVLREILVAAAGSMTRRYIARLDNL
jgi:hypothetical protein